MDLWLVFLLLSGVFSFGWVLGSALGYQTAAATPRSSPICRPSSSESIEVDLPPEDDRRRSQTGVVTQGSLLETV